MNPERDYLSVIIPVHEYFTNKKNKNEEYEDRIVNMLSEKPLSLTELSHAMGYKGITSKLKKTVDSMIERKILAVILGENNKPKIRANK